MGRLLPKIHSALAHFQGDPDVGNQFQKNVSTPYWIRNRFESWKRLRDLSREKLDEATYVVVADIVGFYDNIDIHRLSSDLKLICGELTEISLLRACLEKWATPREKGIPQGHSASDILAKVYFMKSRDAIYDYQLYQLLKMFYEHGGNTNELLKLCRKWSRDSNREPWLRTYVIAYLGRWGDPSDLETLLESYGSLNDEMERAELVAAL